MPLPIMLAHRITHAARRGAQGRRAAVPAARRQVAGDGALRGRRARPPAAGRDRARRSISTQHRDGLDAETLIKPDLIEHVLAPILPHDLYDERRFADRDFVYVNPTGKFVIGGPMGDTGADRAQDHRRHLRRRGAARRRRVLRQGSRPRSTARPPTRRATWRRTSSPRVSPTAARSRSPTRSASPIRCSVLVDCFGTNVVAAGDDRERSSTSTSTCGPAAIIRDLDLRRPIYREDRGVRPLRPRRRTTSPGSAPTRPTRCAPRPVSRSAASV